MLTDPLALDHVLRKQAYAYPKLRLAQRLIGGVMGEGLLVAEQAVHKRQRRALQPGLNARAVRRLHPMFTHHAEALAQHIHTIAQSHGTLVDIYALLSAATLDALGEGALGVHFRALQHVQTDPHGNASSAHPLTAALDRTLRMASQPGRWTMVLDTATLYFPWMEKIPIGLASRRFRREAQVLFDIAGDIVQQAKTRIQDEDANETHPDILATLLRANQNAHKAPASKDAGPRSVLDHATLTDAELQAQVSTLIFAGHETTATQLAWMLLFLAKDPPRQQALYDAIEAKRLAMGLQAQAQSGAPADADTRMLTVDEIESIPYVDWCIHECLRLQSAIHTTSRTPLHDDWIPLANGQYVKVHRGMIILIPLTSICTMDHMWGDDPLSFRPERWREPMPGQRLFPGHHGLAFLLGPRACIGSAFGTW